MLENKYTITIHKEDDWYLAKVGGEDWINITQGKTEEEILEQSIDLIMAVNDIKVSRWSKFWHKVLRLK